MLDDAKEAELKVKEKKRLENRDYMSRLVDIVRLAKGGKFLRGHGKWEYSSDKELLGNRGKSMTLLSKTIQEILLRVILILAT